MEGDWRSRAIPYQEATPPPDAGIKIDAPAPPQVSQETNWRSRALPVQKPPVEAVDKNPVSSPAVAPPTPAAPEEPVTDIPGTSGPVYKTIQNAFVKPIAVAAGLRDALAEDAKTIAKSIADVAAIPGEILYAGRKPTPEDAFNFSTLIAGGAPVAGRITAHPFDELFDPKAVKPEMATELLPPPRPAIEQRPGLTPEPAPPVAGSPTGDVPFVPDAAAPPPRVPNRTDLAAMLDSDKTATQLAKELAQAEKAAAVTPVPPIAPVAAIPAAPPTPPPIELPEAKHSAVRMQVKKMDTEMLLETINNSKNRRLIDAATAEYQARFPYHAAGDLKGHEVEKAAKAVDTEPTEPQKEAGNYQKGHVRIDGLDISIETPRGAERKGVGADGKPWAVPMPDHYGYVKKTEGADGDHVDVYIAAGPPRPTVFVIDQIDPLTGLFDEHKSMLNYPSQEAAVDAYNRAFSDGSGMTRLGAVKAMPMPEFKEWLKSGETDKPLTYKNPAPVALPQNEEKEPEKPVQPSVEQPAYNSVFLAPKQVEKPEIKAKTPQITTEIGKEPQIQPVKQAEAAEKPVSQPVPSSEPTVSPSEPAKTPAEQPVSPEILERATAALAESAKSDPSAPKGVLSSFKEYVDRKDTPDYQKLIRSKEFKSAFKKSFETLGGIPHRESGPYQDYIRGYMDADEGRPPYTKLMNLDFEPVHATAFNPIEPYFMGYMARNSAFFSPIRASQSRGYLKQLERQREGTQTVIPGAERIADKELAERNMEGKAQPKAQQKAPDEGIFDVAARGQGDLMDRQPAPKNKPAAKPKNALRFLASKGGIRDANGELKAMDAHKHFVPGLGHLVRARGLTLDDAGKLLHDAGYFGPVATTERPEINQVLELIRDEIGGKATYAESDRSTVERAAEGSAKRAAEAYREDLEKHADRLGIDPTGLSDEDLEAEIRAQEAIEAAKADFLDEVDAQESEAMRQYYAGDKDLKPVYEENHAPEKTTPASTPPAETQDGARSEGREAVRADAGESAESDKGSERRLVAQPETQDEIPFQRTERRPVEPSPLPRTLEKERLGTIVLTKAAEQTPAQKSTISMVHREMKRIAPEAKIEAHIKMEEDLGNQYPNLLAIHGAYFEVFENQGISHIIAWSLESDDPMATTRHEVIHFLKRAHFITKPEWKALEKTADNRDWLGKHDIINRYPEYSREGQLEEAVAEEYPDWQSKVDKKFGKLPARVQRTFRKMDLFRRRISAGLRDVFGKPPTAEDIFTKIQTGEIGSREKERTLASEKPTLQRPKKPQPVFYSALTTAIETMPQAKANADQWRNIIKNLTQKGVKQEEINWSGVTDWLGEQRGQLEKAKVVDYLSANEIKVSEILKKQNLKNNEDDYSLTDTDDGYIIIDNNGEEIERFGNFENAEMALRDLQNGVTEPDGKGTKYHSYQTPGGKNYRELLLTLPKRMPDIAALNERESKLRAEIKGATDERYHEIMEEIGKIAEERNRKADASKNFRDGHYDEPNVVSHVRFNDRTSPAGEKILHIEEIQSDWHQKGRKKGYGTPPVETNTNEHAKSHPWRVGERLFADKSNAEKFAQEEGRDRVPDAPFKTTWPELAFKRMIRYAADNGYDKITWTTGEQQAERYDLSKQIDRIKYTDLGDGKYNVSIEKDEHPVLRERMNLEQIENAVGKEMAEKIKNGEGREYDRYEGHPVKELTGLDLKIGGEGMKGFYDKILPAVANKLSKKFGANVEELELRLDVRSEYGSDLEPLEVENGKWTVIEGGGNDVAERYFSSEKEAEEWIAAGGNKKLSVHALPITDAMREGVLKGQPLFQRPKTPKPVTAKTHQDGWKDNIKEFKKYLADAKSGKKKNKVPGSNFLKRVLYAADSEIRSIADHVENPKGKELTHKFLDQWHARAGEARSADLTYDEAVSTRINQKMNTLQKIFGDNMKDTKLHDRAVTMVQHPDTIDQSEAGKMASAINDFLDEEQAYMLEAGVDVGKIEEGYFPRVYDESAILASPAAEERFLKAATKAYMLITDHDGNPTPIATARKQAEAWLDHIKFGESGDFNRIGDGPRRPGFTKQRIFPKAADDILKEFLTRDPIEVLVSHTTRVTRRAEFVRRIGDDLEVWDETIKQLRDNGADYMIPLLREYVKIITGMRTPGIDGRWISLLSWLRTWTTLGLLEKATLSSLAEFALAGIRSGNLIDIGRSFGYTVLDLARKYSKTAKERRAWAEDLGIIAGHIGSSLQAARWSGGDPSSKLQNYVMAKYFNRIGLEQWTNSSRSAAVTIGQTFIRRLAKEVIDGKRTSRNFLAELGVQKDSATEFSEWLLKQNDGIPDRDAVVAAGYGGGGGKKTGGGKASTASPDDDDFLRMYRTALIRFTDQSIMRPSAITRPGWAKHPLGAVIFQLMSYNWAFAKNVLNRIKHMTKQRDLSMAERAKMIIPLILLLPSLYVIQLLLGEVRDEVFGNPNGKDKTWAEKQLLAFSRSLAGPFDVPINIFTGVKYNRSVTSSLTGPTVSRLTDAADTVVKGIGNNSEKTNTAERKLASTFYDLGIEPFINFALAGVPATSLFGVALTQAVGAPAAKEAFVSTVAGPRKHKK